MEIHSSVEQSEKSTVTEHPPQFSLIYNSQQSGVLKIFPILIVAITRVSIKYEMPNHHVIIKYNQRAFLK